jgi:transcriptional regulator with XRE-family HTH domain
VANFKDRLREAMAARNMKAVELSEKTGIHKASISYYLSGTNVPKQDRIFLIAKALEVNEAWLMGYDVPAVRTDEQKKNDDLVQVVAQLRKDPEFFEVVKLLAELPASDYASIKQLVTALAKK